MMLMTMQPVTKGGFGLPRALAVGLLPVALAACAPERGASFPDSAVPAARANTLTSAEAAAGWRLLFDGQRFRGWRGLGRDTVPTQHWRIQDGAIYKVPSGEVPVARDGQPLGGGDLTTIDAFRDYELAWEWKVSPGGNSGVKYNVSEEMSVANPPRHAALGFEYQILDDDRHPDAKMGVNGNRTSAGLYDLIGPNGRKQARPVGEWNQARLIFRGNHGEHWLNGEKVLEYDLGTPSMNAALAASKYKDIAGFADRRKGHIVLQDHNDAVWFRNIKIRELR
jgi:hypothetical protein